MRKILAILLFFYVFSISSFAQEDKTKNVPWYLTGPRDYSWSPYAPSVFDPNYLNEYNRWQQYNNSIYRPRPGAIVIQRPRSPLGAFFDGVGVGLVQSFDYYYRKEKQEKHIAGMVELIKILEKKRESIPRPPSGYVLDDYSSLTLSREEREANLKRMRELCIIIEERRKVRQEMIKQLPPLPPGCTIIISDEAVDKYIKEKKDKLGRKMT